MRPAAFPVSCRAWSMALPTGWLTVLDRGLAYHQIAALSSGMGWLMMTVLPAVRLRSVTV